MGLRVVFFSLTDELALCLDLQCVNGFAEGKEEHRIHFLFSQQIPPYSQRSNTVYISNFHYDVHPEKMSFFLCVGPLRCYCCTSIM